MREVVGDRTVDEVITIVLIGVLAAFGVIAYILTSAFYLAALWRHTTRNCRRHFVPERPLWATLQTEESKMPQVTRRNVSDERPAGCHEVR